MEAAAAGTAGSSFVTRSFNMEDVAQYVGQYPSSYAAQGALSPDGKGGWYMKKVLFYPCVCVCQCVCVCVCVSVCVCV
jgi:hypothetical protein